MTAGFHSPLPPERTGVADYSAALLSALQRRISVRVNDTAPCDVELYHLGNNQLHRRIYRQAMERPGVVVLHDALLQHFFLGSLEANSYEEEFVYNYGEWSRLLARELFRGRARSAVAPDYFRYAMLRRIAERSLAVIVHNPAAAARVREHAPAANVVEIPHLYQEAASPAAFDVERLRHARFIFGVFGYLRESKQLPMVLRVFERLRRRDPSLGLLVAGAFASPDLARACAPALLQPGITRIEFLPERDFLLRAHAIDCCINLREPPAGETSGIAIRMMGIGKAVIVTAGDEVSRFPEAACARVDAGLPSEETLAAIMLWLSLRPERARGMGRAAAAHIREKHSLDRAVDAYCSVLKEVA